MIHVDDAEDITLYNREPYAPTRGIIHSLMEVNLVYGREESSQPIGELYAVVHLDSPLSTSGGEVSWLLASPRHTGYGLPSICLSFITVNVIFVEGPNPPVGLRWEGPDAICSMKLVR